MFYDDNIEKIYEDEKSWMYFEGETKEETIGVYCKCHCGQFLKRGQLLMNKAGEVKLVNFICKKHGEVTPYFDRDI